MTDVVTFFGSSSQRAQNIPLTWWRSWFARIVFQLSMQEQFAVLMQQQAQLTTTVQQLIQFQHANQAAAGTASPSYPEQAGFRSAKIFDLRHLKYTTFDGTPSTYDDWAFSFKRAIRSSNCDAYKMLVQVERVTDEFREDVVDPQFEGLRMESVSAELYDLLCQACTGDALSCIRAVEDVRGLTAWQRSYKKYNPRTMARAIRLVAAFTHPPKVK